MDSRSWIEDGGTLRRSFAWTSYGQLRRLDYTAAPALHRLSGGLAYGPADVRCDFLHDASGSRYLQRKLRTAPDASRVTEETLYLGSYERERHFTGTSSVPDRTVHRHSIGGFAVYTRTVESTGSVTRLSTILKDHLGSTDVIITGRWVATTFGEIRTERQSFDPWGERRDPATLALFRLSATDPFRTSSEDHDRGYTGHEQLDDSGLIHMNGRIYDPELGRMLSPDPFVQVPEYSQNFNRYSYVLNNPLNKTDPSGYSWLSEAFDKVGDWFSENWRTIVIVVVSVVVGAISGGLASAWAVGMGFSTATTAAIGAGVGTFWGTFTSLVLTGASVGDALVGSLKAGAIAAVTAYAWQSALEFAVDLTNPNQEAELYKIDGKTGEVAQIDPSTVDDGSLRGTAYINGMNNDLQSAKTNAMLRNPGKDTYLLHNPKNTALADFLECGLDKLSGQSRISKSTASLLAKFDPASTTIVGHSQGTMIATNALNILAESQSIEGFHMISYGSAQNEVTARLILSARGVSVGSFGNHPFDAVANIVGFNALTKPNPYRLFGSLIASPLLFTESYYSPHSRPWGGGFLKWAPWLYDTPTNQIPRSY